MIKRVIKLLALRKKWRKRNQHNETTITKIFNINQVYVGNGTYGRINVSTFTNEDMLMLKIGNYCSIAGNVSFICGGEHYLDRLLTFPVEKKVFGETEALSKGPIIVEDDVWIATNAIILSGVKIGRGSVIAAGSIVTKDIPPYSIAAGCPAKVIRKRFNDDIIDKLLKCDYSELNTDLINNNRNVFIQTISNDNIDNILTTVFNQDGENLK